MTATPNSKDRQRDGRPNISKEQTPDHAVESFGGTFHEINARHLRTRRCNRQCLQFWFLSVFIIVLAVLSVVVIIWKGYASEEGKYFVNVLSLCIGVMVPNPKYKKK